MLVYQGDKQSFIQDSDDLIIVEKLRNEYISHFGNPSQSMVRSWTNSLPKMRSILSDKEIPDDSGVAIEYNIPATSNKVDFIISGSDENNKNSIVIIELKQWEECSTVNDSDGIIHYQDEDDTNTKVWTYVGQGYRKTTHPSYQAMSYAHLIRNFCSAIEENDIGLYPCAYLHNYEIKPNCSILDDKYKDYIEGAPVFGFGKNEADKLKAFIKKYIKYGDHKDLLFEIDNCGLHPSKRLQDAVANMLDGKQEYVMIDEQKIVFEEALKIARRSIAHRQKEVLIVQGGPGTGKTVVAMNLLVEMHKREYSAFYTSKNSSVRDAFLDNIKHYEHKLDVKNVITGAGTFLSLDNDSIDCIIVDESHRLINKRFGVYNGESQIDDIIRTSKFSVFFIDEDQIVTTFDKGTIDEIKTRAQKYNAKVTMTELVSQFRCQGSNGYLSWLDNVLDIRETANYNFDFNYEFKVFDDPNEMFERIKELNVENNKSRVVAGYCWNWIKEGKNNPNCYDIQIGDFKKSWNLGTSGVWAISKGTINQVGCIHTCQGLEFDYVGVIIGDDLRYENDKIVTDFTKRAYTDKALNGIKALYKNDKEKALSISDRIIKNTYKTLMTRGMKGCYVYCTNKELAEYLKEKSK